MLKRHPARDGAVQLGGERLHPTQNRKILQANAIARLRRDALLFGAWWTEARNG